MHNGPTNPTTLNPRQLLDLAPLARDIEHSVAPLLNLDVDNSAFFDAAAHAASQLPAQLLARLLQFRNDGRDGALLLRGLPQTDESTERMSRRGNAYIALIASRVGEIVGYRQEKDGLLIHDIYPSRADEHKQAASGSRVLLELHTERNFHPFLPDYVVLYCIRPDHDHKAATLLASAADIIARLPDDIVDLLYQPVFRTGVDYIFGNVETSKGNGPVLSILYGDRKAPCMRYDADLMVGLNNDAERALAILREAAMTESTEVRLSAGDYLILDNRYAVHGRSAFTPRYDGQDRWLKRAHVAADLRHTEGERKPGSRVIETVIEFF